MARHFLVCLAALAIAGCNTPTTKIEPLTDTEVKLVDTPSRGLTILFKAPGSLASGATIIASGGLNFRVSATSDGYKPVAKASVQLRALDDTPVGKPASTDDQGVISYNHVPDGRTLSAVASFSVGGKSYELATLLPPGAPPERVIADPLATMIDARIKQVSGRLTNLSSPSFERIERVRALCDKAGVTIATGDLVAGQGLDRLNQVWTSEVAAKVTVAAEKAEITGFVEAASKEARIK